MTIKERGEKFQEQLNNLPSRLKSYKTFLNNEILPIYTGKYSHPTMSYAKDARSILKTQPDFRKLKLGEGSKSFTKDGYFDCIGFLDYKLSINEKDYIETQKMKKEAKKQAKFDKIADRYPTRSSKLAEEGLGLAKEANKISKKALFCSVVFPLLALLISLYTCHNQKVIEEKNLTTVEMSTK